MTISDHLKLNRIGKLITGYWPMARVLSTVRFMKREVHCKVYEEKKENKGRKGIYIPKLIFILRSFCNSTVKVSIKKRYSYSSRLNQNHFGHG